MGAYAPRLRRPRLADAEPPAEPLASAYDAGWTAGRSSGLNYDPDAIMRADLAVQKMDLDVIRALGYDVVKRS